MRKKIYPEEKCEIVRRVKAGEYSQRHAAELMGIHVASLQAWIRIYDSEGPEGLIRAKNRSYSDELKLQAVKEYLDGQGSMGAICKKYKIRGNAQLQDWIMMYNAHGDIARKKRGGGSYMKQGRNTTKEERLEIAKACIESGKDYRNGRQASLRHWYLNKVCEFESRSVHQNHDQLLENFPLRVGPRFISDQWLLA